MRRVVAICADARHDTDGEAAIIVDLPHPRAVAAREIIVDGDDLHTLPRERVEGRGERGDKRLALAGAHLGDFPAKKSKTADELHIEVGLFEGPARRLAHERKHERDIILRRCAGLYRAGAHYGEPSAHRLV